MTNLELLKQITTEYVLKNSSAIFPENIALVTLMSYQSMIEGVIFPDYQTIMNKVFNDVFNSDHEIPIEDILYPILTEYQKKIEDNMKSLLSESESFKEKI